MTHDDDRDLTGAEIDAVRRHRRSPADPAARRSVRASAPARAGTRDLSDDDVRDLRDRLRAYGDDRERRAVAMFRDEGALDIDDVRHYLYVADDVATNPDANRRTHELTRTMAGFLAELGVYVPARVRLVRRCSGPDWARASAARRAAIKHYPAHGELAVRVYGKGATLEVLLDSTLSHAESLATLLHESHHAWVSLACPAYRRHEFADPVAAERAADLYAADALRARGLPVPALIVDRDLSSYARS